MTVKTKFIMMSAGILDELGNKKIPSQKRGRRSKYTLLQRRHYFKNVDKENFRSTGLHTYPIPNLSEIREGKIILQVMYQVKIILTPKAEEMTSKIKFKTPSLT